MPKSHIIRADSTSTGNACLCVLCAWLLFNAYHSTLEENMGFCTVNWQKHLHVVKYMKGYKYRERRKPLFKIWTWTVRGWFLFFFFLSQEQEQFPTCGCALMKMDWVYVWNVYLVIPHPEKWTFNLYDLWCNFQYHVVKYLKKRVHFISALSIRIVKFEFIFNAFRKPSVAMIYYIIYFTFITILTL